MAEAKKTEKKKTLKEEYEAISAEIAEAEQAIRDAFTEEEEQAALDALKKKQKEFDRIAKKYYNEPVTIRLFRDNGKYADDVFVGWNDRNFLIQRGVDVEVPRGVAEIVRQSEEQKNSAALMMDDMSSRFETDSRARGIN